MRNPFKKRSKKKFELINAMHANSDLVAIKKIIKSNPNSLFEADIEEVYTALHYAAWDNKFDIVKLLIKSGAEIDPVGKDGLSPFLLAANNGFYEVVEILADNGANINRIWKDSEDPYQGVSGSSAIRKASLNQYWKIVNFLLDRDVKLEILLEPCLGFPKSDFFEVIRASGIANENIYNDPDEINTFKEVVKERLNINSEKKEVEQENESEDDTKGYPGILIKTRKDADGNKDENLNARIRKYLVNWQCPTESYNGRMGIEGRIPSWIHKIDTDACCPKFSNKEIEFINNKIVTEKIIPVLSFAPEEFYNETKQVWWIVPLSIWAGDKASWLFIDKNGIYAAHPGDEDMALIFSWDRLEDMEYDDKDLDTNESEVHSLDLITDEGDLTLVEFVSPGQGSYLSIINSIYQIRKETIEASKDEGTWFEGAGGEGFKGFQKPKDLLDDNKWEDPSRPNPEVFGLVKDEEVSKEKKEITKEQINDLEWAHTVLDLLHKYNVNKISREPTFGSVFDDDAVLKMEVIQPTLYPLDELDGEYGDVTNDGCLYSEGFLEINWNLLEDMIDTAIENKNAEYKDDFGSTILLNGKDRILDLLILHCNNLKNPVSEEEKKIFKEADVNWGKKRTKDYFNQGKEKFENKDYQGAIEDFTKAIKINPENYDLYEIRGDSNRALDNFQGAVNDYTKAIEIDGEWWGYYSKRAEVRIILKEYQLAIKDCDKAIGINPKKDVLYKIRGVAKKALNNFQGAAEDFTKAIEIDGEWWGYYSKRAEVRIILKEYQLAIKDCDKVIELNPKYKWAYQDRGTAKSELKDFQGAIEDYSKVIALDPNYKWAYQNRGNTKSKLKDFEGAMEDYSKVIALDSNYKWAYQQRGIAKSELKDHIGVIEDLSKVIELDANNRWNFWKRAEAKREINDFKEAIIDYNKAIELDPNYDWAYYGRALANKSIKKDESVVSDLNKAIEINPNWWVLYKVRGEAKVSLEDYKNTIDDFIKAIELNPYGSWINVGKDFFDLIKAFEKNLDIELVAIKKEFESVDLERAPLVEFLNNLKIEIEKCNLAKSNNGGSKGIEAPDIIQSDNTKNENEINISDSGSTQSVETENSVTKVGNVILYSDFDTWIAEMRNGQIADKSKGIKDRKPIEITQEAEAVVRRFFDDLSLKCNEEDLLSFKFSPTGGCTVYFKKRKVAGIAILKKNIIQLMILRDYNKKYYRPIIEELNISNIREEQISYKVPWGYAFYIILNEPKLIDKYFDTLFSFIEDGITTIKFDRILSLKAKEYRKLKPIFDGTFYINEN